MVEVFERFAIDQVAKPGYLQVGNEEMLDREYSEVHEDHKNYPATYKESLLESAG
jgi:hypothetical protein